MVEAREVDEFDSIMGKLDAEVGQDMQIGGVVVDHSNEEVVGVDLHEKELAEQGLNIYGQPLGRRTKKRYARQEPRVKECVRSDVRDLKGRAYFGRSFIQRPVCQSQLALEMLKREGEKPRWAVEGCVTLRGGGVCEVCGETVRAQGSVMQVEPTCRGGLYEEKNCLYVCRHCAVCWFPAKSFNHFMGIAATVHTLSVAVMRRRKQEYKRSKFLSPEACVRFKEMYEVERERTVELQKEVKESLNRSLNEEKEV